jgi:hypothetical protein
VIVASLEIAGSVSARVTLITVVIIQSRDWSCVSRTDAKKGTKKEKKKKGKKIHKATRKKD